MNLAKTLFAAATAILILSSLAISQIQFLPSAAVTTGITVPANPADNDARGLEVADVNLDGNLDIVVCDSFVDEIAVLLGDGLGAFVPLTAITSTGGLRDIEVLDVNGDLLPDLVISRQSDDMVEVFLGDGTGGFVSSQVLGLGASTGPRALGSADFDLDGDRDVVVALFATSQFMLLRNDSGIFTPIGPFNTLGSNAYDLTVGDLNGDFRPDVIVSNSSFSGGPTDNVAVFLNDNAGGFLPPTTTANGFFNSGVIVADINLDSFPDVVASNFVNTTGNLFPMLGDGTGALTTGTPGSGGVHINGIRSGDFDLDGDIDIVAYDVGTGSGQAFENNGGMLVPVQTLPTVTIPGATATGDLNGDGSVDIVITNREGGSISIYLNQNFSPSLPDTCAQSHVPDGFGGVEDVLLIQGSTGGADRRVDLALSQIAVLDLVQPSVNGVPSSFLIWGQVFTPSQQLSVFVLPFGLGTTCLIPSQADPLNQSLILIANNFGGNDPMALVPSFLAPFALGFTATGVDSTIILQGLISLSTTEVAITNAIMVRTS
ncbi:MAG: VCBS repeat-containing protein [Planctomycetota bacterium]